MAGYYGSMIIGYLAEISLSMKYFGISRTDSASSNLDQYFFPPNFGYLYFFVSEILFSVNYYPFNFSTSSKNNLN